MYTNFFRLNEPPFSLTPDPRYLYMSEKHREGLAHLLFGVQQPGGFVQLTGEIGCGKTTLCRCLVSQLPAGTDIALILNPRLTVIELLAVFCDELHIPYPDGTDSVKLLIDAINKYLLLSHAEGRRTVLVIDEAQNLDRDVLEQIRLLTNLETEQEKLLQIILIGQPELNTVLKDPSLQQLAQRITARYHLKPLSRQETTAYIQHRLFVAGVSAPLFTRQALNETYKITGGVPRLINIICDRALLGAYTLDKRLIDKSIVRKSAREIKTPYIRPRSRRFMYAGIVLALVILLGVLVYISGFLEWQRSNRSAQGSELLNTGTNLDTVDPANTASVSDSRSPSGDAAPESEMNPDTKPQISRANAQITFDPEGENASYMPVVASSIRMEDIVGSTSLADSLYLSFNNLYAAWRVPVQIGPWDMGCSAGESYGFRCLFLSGDWLKIRRLDLPVIMRLELPSRETSHVTLVGLKENYATIAVGSNTYTVPVQDIDRLWDGSFILIWKPPFDSLLLTQGMQGEEINWIQQTLDAHEGRIQTSDPSALFDRDLRERIVLFQQTENLLPDGRVGPETLLRLSIVSDASNIPLLSQYTVTGENT